MKFWNLITPRSFIASCIWNLSEKNNINLGSIAPLIFRWMVGVRKRNVKQLEDKK